MAALGWGILGAGGIARIFARDLRTAGLRVVAVGSRAADTAEAFGRELDVPHRHASYEALCDDPGVDVVYVATPHSMHRDNALLALRAGKHVLVEKPFTINAFEARELVAEARKRGLFLMEAMWTRFLPTMVALRELIGGGALGEIRSVLADHCQYIPIERAKRLHLPELGGGALLDLGVYPVSFAHMLLGKPDEIAATARLTELGVDENLSLSLAWSGGQRASLHCDMMGQGPNRAAVVGSRGWVEFDRVWYNQTNWVHYAQDGSVVRRFDDRVEGRGMQCQALEVEAIVASGNGDRGNSDHGDSARGDDHSVESPIMSHGATIEVMEIMDAIRAKIGVRYPGE